MSDVLVALSISPIAGLFGALAIVPVIAWVYTVVSWMIMEEMDVLFGVCAIMVAALLGYVCLVPPEPYFSPLAFTGLVGMMIVYPVAKRQLDRRANALIEVEQIEKAYLTLAEKPDNAAAMFKLADGLYVRGLVSQALAIADQALVSMPKNLFPAEHRTVELWRRHSPKVAAPLPCLRCGHRNDPAAVFCQTCGAHHLALYARGKWLGRALAWKLVAAWAAASVALIGVPVTLKVVPGTAERAVLIVLQSLFAALLLWRAFASKEDQGP